MSAVNFNEISERYEKDSLIQKNASEMLIGLLQVGGDEKILDIGCGTGGITAKLASLTKGPVAGIDPSEGMIREASALYGNKRLTFRTASAETMDYNDAFDILFCNSAFQWFRDPAKALANCFQALKKNGRMGIQAPATSDYCPNFVEAIRRVRTDPRTKGVFARFQSPWLFLESAEEYSSLFVKAGFRVGFSKIEKKTTLHTSEEASAIFESGAAAGYLNGDCYGGTLDESYRRDFRQILKTALNGQVKKDGKLELVFHRIYLVAVKA